jgi:hypothetical protein
VTLTVQEGGRGDELIMYQRKHCTVHSDLSNRERGDGSSSAYSGGPSSSWPTPSSFLRLPDICKDFLRPCPVKLCVRWVELALADALGVARQYKDHIFYL